MEKTLGLDLEDFLMSVQLYPVRHCTRNGSLPSSVQFLPRHDTSKVGVTETKNTHVWPVMAGSG